MVLPIVCVALIAIKLVDSGPGFYMQNRQGKDGRPFKFVKLRTMRMHSDVRLRDYLAQNPTATDPRIYRNARDPRILPVVGTFLRRYSIDELPQIWNVVRGDMSLVGPRALPDYHCKVLRPEFLALRSRVRPGITGLWQVEGRSNADPDSIEAYDSQYLANWSLGADLRILCRTVGCVLRGSGL
jgi:lipopolysaccharide/colanic/teichoic acid biosynthesis glycosyltransferase